MKRFPIIVTLLIFFLAMTSICQGQQIGHTHLMPYSLDYPMIRAALYKGIGPSLHAQNFGVVKVFRNDITAHFERALKESYNWSRNWASYGTLGNGEDLFTRRAARFRNSHQGR